ncbi:MAG TPA: DUF4129 domain-containing protein [Candidatus Methylacidiphilales bacterium]|nr:DUF4129 domain-containing protein [Candidatus Methylacidiphilales bacterium]
MIRVLLFALALADGLGALPSRAGDDAPDLRPAPVTDPTQVAAHYQTILQKPEFHDSGEVDADERLRDMLTQWFFRLGQKMSQFKYVSEMSRVASIVLTGMVVLCVGGVIYVAVRIYRRRTEFDQDKTADMPGQKTFRPPEFYEKEIQEAVRAGDWHAAWLAAWRQFLSRLENRQLVEADRTRTNHEYLAQLRERMPRSPALALLTAMVNAYDLYIYGHKPVAEPDWNLFHRQISEAGLLLRLENSTPHPQSSPP